MNFVFVNYLKIDQQTPIKSNESKLHDNQIYIGKHERCFLANYEKTAGVSELYALYLVS